MRLCYVISSLMVGGAERLLVNLINNIPLEHRVQIILFKEPAPLVDAIDRPEVEIVRLDTTSYCSWAAVSRLIRAVRSFRPNVVHTHMNSSNLILRILRPFLLDGMILVNQYHGLSLWKSRALTWLDRSTAFLVDLVICCSSASLARRANFERLPQEKLVLLTNAVDLRAFRPRVPVPGAPWVIGTACRLTENKRVGRLLEWHAALLVAGYDVDCRIAGDGPERERLIALAAKLGYADRVTFLGQVGDMVEFYRDLDVFLLSSKLEDLPMVLIEAMASGCATASHATGGVRDVLDGAPGAAVVDLDSDGWMVELERLLLRSRCTEVIDGNCAHVRQYGMDVYIDRLFDVYRAAGASDAAGT